MQILGVVNNGDNTYTMEFSEPITFVNAGSNEPNWLLNSFSNGGWSGIQWLSQDDATHATMTREPQESDCQGFAALAQPFNIGFDDEIQLATPTQQIM